MGQQTISRHDLFNLIWTKPTAKVAEEFGVSDVAIAKWCKKMEIPKPPRGYWAKKQVGKTVSKPPKLKKLSTNGVDRIEWTPPPLARPKEEATQPQIATIAGSLECPHKLVKTTLGALRTGKPWGDRHIIYPKRKGVLDIRVTPNSIERACLLFDSLIKTFEAEGLHVFLKAGEHTSKTFVQVDDYQIEVGIDEQTNRVPIPKDPKRKYSYPRHDFVPTGKLTFSVKSWSPGIRSEWRDGKIKKIEGQIPSIIHSLRSIAVKHHQWELEKAEREKRWKQAQEKRRKEAVKGLKCQKIVEHMKSWEKSRNLKTYLEALKETFKLTPELDEYINLGLEYADQINPLNWKELPVFNDENLERELPYQYR